MVKERRWQRRGEHFPCGKRRARLKERKGTTSERNILSIPPQNQCAKIKKARGEQAKPFTGR
jgi:hypothetical protein